MGGGGGLLVYIKIGLQILKIDAEATLFQLCKMMVKDIIVDLLYRPLSTQADSRTGTAAALRAAEKNCVIFGDSIFQTLIGSMIWRGAGRASCWKQWRTQ